MPSQTNRGANIHPKLDKERRRRLPAGERRSQLIRVAQQIFSKQGFSGTTTKQIAKAAGVSEAVIFRHFLNKEDLYAAILNERCRQAGAESWVEELRIYADRRDDVGLFLSLGTRILDSYRKDPAFQRLLFYSALEGHELARVFYETRGLPIFNFLREYISLRQHEGAFRLFDPGAAVFALVAMPSYHAIINRLLGLGFPSLSDEEMLNTFVQLLLDGLRTGPAGSKGSRQ